VTTARRTLAAIFTCAIGVAACTSGGNDVAEVEANRATVPPGSTLAPAPVDGSTPITAPDPDGLPSIAEPDPEIRFGELDNGLRYIVRENDSPGASVEMRLAVDAGSAQQDTSQDGGAHFLEHMLFNGTEQFPENELVDVLRSFGAGFGADINAYTSYDETVYQLTMPTDDDDVVNTGLDVLQQWLSAATIAEDQVESERGVIVDEWRLSATSSDGRIFDGLEELFLTGSPYESQDPIGEEASITSMTGEPLRRFYDDWYRPDNAAVIVVGDIDADEIEAAIIERFEPLVSRGASPERTELTVSPSTEPQVSVFSDPDLGAGFAQVTLPSAPVMEPTPEAELQMSILDAMAFDIVATRLANDARRGDAPFDGARVDSSAIVRGLDAPEIVVDAHGDSMEAATEAVFDEYERVRRFGFTEAEVARAASTVRAGIDSFFQGRDSRQDAEFAEEYVRHVLTDEPVPTAEAQHDFANAVLDRATPETVAYGFVRRLASSAPHVMVVVPDSEADDLPADEVFLAQATGAAGRELEPRADEAAVEDSLMIAPEPVEEASADDLADGDVVSFVAPGILRFDNGVTVSLNTTDIAEGQVDFEARSPGGHAAIPDVDVAAADALGAVLAGSGVGEYDAVALDAILADKDVTLEVGIDAFTEGMYGTAATSDLEALFQLVHLTMTEPRVDEVALAQYLDDELPYAEDPSIDPGYAEFAALLDARYDDPRYLLPTVESLSTLTVADIERVTRDRFGDASDFSFAFSGDFDLDEATDLARRYLGTLPSTDRVETVDYVEPEPPAGVVEQTVNAGDGEQAGVTLLFTAPATPERVDDVAALVVQEVITARLTDTIREDLGESYSPFAFAEVGDGGSPYVATYISNSTGADQVDDVVAAVGSELDDLRENGPTTAEFDAAIESVRQDLDLFANAQINDEVLSVLTDPTGSPSLDDFLGQAFLVDELDLDTVRSYLADWLPAEQYIEIKLLPR
jgi:zinc protease